MDVPDNIGYQESLAGRYWNIGDHEKSVECYRKLARDNPSVVSFWEKLARWNTAWGKIQKDSGKLDESIGTLEYSLEIYQRLVRDYPKNENFLGGLGGCYKRLADVLQAAGKTGDAAAAYQTSIATLKELTYFKGMLCDAYLSLSRTQEQAGKLEESIASQKEMLKTSRQLLERSPNQIHFRSVQSAMYRRLGESFRRVGRFDEAFTAYKDAVATLEGEFVDGNTPDGTPEQVRNARREWEKSRQQRFRAETERLIGRAENDRSELLDEFYSNAERNDAWFLIGRGGWHQSHGELDLALADFRTAQNQEPSAVAQRRIILLLLQQGDTRKAIDELPEIDELDSTSAFIQKAALIAYAGEESPYRQLCERMLEKICDQ